MPYRLDLDRPIGEAVRRVAAECLDDADERLGDLVEGRGDAARHVHETRKRCKELRGLIRLVAPAVGDRRAKRADRAVRDAARLLSALRDAHVQQGTLLRLAAAGFVPRPATDVPGGDGPGVASEGASEPTPDRIVEAARGASDLLDEAREQILGWELDDDIDACCEGVATIHRAGRRALDDFRADPDDLAEHEWRKDVKYLWYQMRLLRDVDPPTIEPLIARLDDLGEALGDDHDLAVLVADRDARDPVVDAARAAQTELRRRSVAAGRRIYSEKPRSFAERIRAQWMLSRELVDESPVGGLALLAAEAETAEPDPERGGGGGEESAGESVERERRFLVEGLGGGTGQGDAPDLASAPVTHIRQGYLALDRGVSVRVRATDRSAPVLTVKAGAGAVRTEVECPLDQGWFDALWPLTEGRRIDKRRHEIGLPEGLTATVDVFDGALAGLVLVEVEFGDDGSLGSFTPPPWFGPEVTDDGRFTNAALSTATEVPRAVTD